ncbi:serine/threonine-protein kinase protein CCR3 [Spatholobus suberectus]|nr:serine/threonine-protein kinase protein CCR3 [Spatholobus suberectus]
MELDSEIESIDTANSTVDAVSYTWAVDSAIRSNESNFGASPGHSFASVVDSAIWSSCASEADHEAHNSTSTNFPSQAHTEVSLGMNFSGGEALEEPPSPHYSPDYQTQQADFQHLHHHSNTRFSGISGEAFNSHPPLHHNHSSSHYGVGLGPSHETSSGMMRSRCIDLLITTTDKPAASSGLQMDQEKMTCRSPMGSSGDIRQFSDRRGLSDQPVQQDSYDIGMSLSLAVFL